MSLDMLRNEIDAIDDELCALFVRRMELAAAVAREKAVTGGPVYHPARETAILERLYAQTDPQWHDSIEQLYMALFQVSRDYQQSLLGEEAAPCATD